MLTACWCAGRSSIPWPPSFKLDVADGFNNHWHVKAALLKEIPATGVRLYNYFDDGHPGKTARGAGMRALRRAQRSEDRPRACDRGRTLDLRHPQHRRGDAGVQMAGSGGAAHPRSRRRRRDGDECAALPVAALPVRRVPPHITPPRNPRGFCGTTAPPRWDRGAPLRHRRGGGARRRHRGRRHHVLRHHGPGTLAQTRVAIHFAARREVDPDGPGSAWTRSCSTVGR